MLLLVIIGFCFVTSHLGESGSDCAGRFAKLLYFWHSLFIVISCLLFLQVDFIWFIQLIYWSVDFLDTDACQNSNHNCPKYSTCVSKRDYRCKCKRGYVMNKGKCYGKYLYSTILLWFIRFALLYRLGR